MILNIKARGTAHRAHAGNNSGSEFTEALINPTCHHKRHDK